MPYLVATGEGLHRLADDGTPTQLMDVPTRHVVAADEGAVALADDRTLWSVDDDGAAEFDSLANTEPQCLLLNGDDVWIGTREAHLFRLHDGEHERIRSFDTVSGRDAWHTPYGAPAEVRSMDVDDDGVLYVNVHVGGIVRSLDDGNSWEPTLDIDLDVHQVVTVPDYAKTVVAACAAGFALSTDQGESWEVEDAGLHATYSRAVAVAGDAVVISVSDGPGGGQSALYRRALDGDRFLRCSVGLPDWFAGNVDTHCLAAWDETVVAGTADGRVFLSADSGRSWALLARGLAAVRAIAIL